MFRLIAARENLVFRVDHKKTSYALRLRRKGYRTDAELWSELEWIQATTHGGLGVPTPICSTSWKFFHVINGVQVDGVSWLPGHPIGKTGAPLKIPDRIGLFQHIGCEMARLHNISDQWTPPAGFTRCAWDRKGLLGDTPVWNRFWENPTLSKADQSLFGEIREATDQDLAQIEHHLDFGLIHADLVRENILTSSDFLNLIDFDDGGFGFRLFDLATTLLKNRPEKNYPALRTALTDGYRSIREIDLTALDLFILLRSNTYVGWIMTRMQETGSETLNQSFVTTTRQLGQAYLEQRCEEGKAVANWYHRILGLNHYINLRTGPSI